MKRSNSSSSAAPDDGKRIRLTPRAATACQRRRESAAHDGMILLPLSGFRSTARQTKIIRTKLAAGQSIDAILRFGTAFLIARQRDPTP